MTKAEVNKEARKRGYGNIKALFRGVEGRSWVGCVRSLGFNITGKGAARKFTAPAGLLLSPDCHSSALPCATQSGGEQASG